MGRRVLAVTSSIIVMMLAGPAWAKVIPSETSVEVDGTTAIVTIDVDSHEGVVPPDAVESMVALYRADSLDETGRPTAGDLGIPIDLEQVDDYTYRATLELPEGGEWAIVPFPFDPEMPASMYPSTTFIVEPAVPAVVPAAPAPEAPIEAENAVLAPALAVGALLFVGVLAVTLWRSIRRRSDLVAVPEGTVG